MKPQNIILSIIIALGFFILIIFPLTSNAATIFTDDFESYNIGLLDGQGGWTTNTESIKVQNTYVKEGEKGMDMFDFYYIGVDARKSGTLLNDGQITIYFMAGNPLWQIFTVFLEEGANERIEVRFPHGRAQYFDGSSYVTFSTYETNPRPLVWSSIQIQWRSSDHTARYSVNQGQWTPWSPTKSAWTSGLDTVHLRTKASILRLDAIQENLLGVEPKNPVLIVPGLLGSAQKNGQWVIDPILHTYDNLIDTLKINGYIQDETLFTLPYNWRQSNIDTAVELKNKINQIKDICYCSKIDIATHSMGGLAARQYIESNDYQNDIDKLIFLGTPHLGAPKDYLMWEAGEADKNAEDKFMKFIFSIEAKKQGYPNLFDYIRNKPISSIQELLPIYNYLVDANPLSVRHYPEGYPINSFLENLNNNLPVLTNSNVTVYNIVGDSQDNSTINYIRVVPSANLPLWQDGYPEGFYESEGDRGLALGSGDGTAPTQSSNIFSDTVSISSNHINLPTNAESQILIDLLGPGQYATSNNFYFPNLKILIIKLLSPVDMQVMDPDGKRIGKDFTSNQEINEIPYAFYSGFQTDDEYITIINPQDGEYKVITQGTDNGGEYTVSTALISDTQDIEQNFQAYIASGQTENLNLNLSSSNGTIDITPEDTTPPEITISSPQEQDYLRSDNLSIDYSVSDSESGVFSSSAKIDNINVENGENIDLFYQPLGEHSFTVQAKDNVNNETSQTVGFRVIATIESTISDINRAYSLGWIKKQSVRDGLIRRINRATKIIEKIQNVEQRFSDKPKLSEKIQKIEKKLDDVFAKIILHKLDILKKTRKINQQAYDIISEDINWLINNN